MRIPTHHDRGNMPDDRSMTSMIDVVFLLLIFFVCASIGQMREVLLGTELSPGTIGAEEVEQQPKPLGDVTLFLRVDANGNAEVQLGEGGAVFRQGDSPELKDAADYKKLIATLEGLAKGAPEIPVILDMQPGVEMGIFLNIYNACRRAGFQTVNVATDGRNAFR